MIMLLVIHDQKLPIHIDAKFPLRFYPDIIKKIFRIGISTGIDNYIFQIGKIMAQSLVAGKRLPPAEPGKPDAGGAPTLLYVEDNPANLRLVEEILRFRNDFRLLTASDGLEGVEMARTHLPYLILMDMNLPGMSGSEAQKMLSADPLTSDIPVIALTANAMPNDVKAGLAAGFFRYVTKPIDIDEFTEAIDSALAFRAQGQQEKS